MEKDEVHIHRFIIDSSETDFPFFPHCPKDTAVLFFRPGKRVEIYIDETFGSLDPKGLLGIHASIIHGKRKVVRRGGEKLVYNHEWNNWRNRHIVGLCRRSVK